MSQSDVISWLAGSVRTLMKRVADLELQLQLQMQSQSHHVPDEFYSNVLEKMSRQFELMPKQQHQQQQQQQQKSRPINEDHIGIATSMQSVTTQHHSSVAKLDHQQVQCEDQCGRQSCDHKFLDCKSLLGVMKSALQGQHDDSKDLHKNDVTMYDLDVPMEEFILLLQGVNIFHDDADISDSESSFDDDT